MTRLTITLPVWNAMPFLKDAVESVLAQSYRDFRFVILDDGSTDDSLNYLRSIRDSRVEVHTQKNMGLGATLNRLIELCDSEWMGRMDADDIADREKFALQMAFLAAHPDVVMVGTQVRFQVGEKSCRFSSAPLDHRGIVERLRHGKAGVSHPTVVFRTAAARAIGGYRVHGVGEDLDFCLRICDQGQVANLEQELYSYRIHASSIVSKRRQEIHCGYDYAIHCAACREAGREEPRFDVFQGAWQNRNWRARWATALDDFAEDQYRRGICSLANGFSLTGWGHIAVTALLRPANAISRIEALFKRMLREFPRERMLGRWMSFAHGLHLGMGVSSRRNRIGEARAGK